MSRRKLIRNVSAVSLGAMALALCSYPREHKEGTKRVPMPAPEGRENAKPNDLAVREIPQPAFGGEPAAKPESKRKSEFISSTGSHFAGTAPPAIPLAEPEPHATLTRAEQPSPFPAPELVDRAPPLAAFGVSGAASERAEEPALEAESYEEAPLEPSRGKVEVEAEAAPRLERVAGPALSVASPPAIEAADGPDDTMANNAADIEAPGPAAEVAEATPAQAELVEAPAIETAAAETVTQAPDPSATAAEAAPAITPEAAVEPVPAAESSSRIRVWDFKTGAPIAPAAPDQKIETAAPAAAPSEEPPPSEPVEQANPPDVVEANPVDSIADDAPALALEPVQAGREEPPSDSAAAPDTAEISALTPSSDKARVWDFRTGAPIPPGAAAPKTSQQAASAAPKEPAPQEANGSTDAATVVQAVASSSFDGGSADMPVLTYQDELILEVKVKGFDASDTIVAYGTHEGIYLPLGAMARILDLAITVSDEGHYAHGWILKQDQMLAIDLRQGIIETNGQQRAIKGPLAAAFEGELYLRVDQYAELFPLKIEADLRSMAVAIETLEPFPFQLRAERDAKRERLEAHENRGEGRSFERIDMPWEAASVPAADVAIRAVSDSTFGPRMEGELRLAGDLGYLSADAYLSGDTKNGATAALIELGRVDPDGDLLGPLSAKAFSVGDVSTESMSLGLRSVSGRGLSITNSATQMASVFDRVDLRGILPDGYEVELYRNDVLIGSTRDAVNGQYEFLQVPVDFGLNVFRIVFYGPQGQRSETVRRISVGDGRVAKGELVYSLGAAQKDRNVLGVKPPNFVPPRDYSNWRAGGQLAYGVTSGLTALLGASWFERDGDNWLASAGIRTSVAEYAIKADVGMSNGGAMAYGGGIGGRFGRSALTLSHTEYTGLFPDETKTTGLQFLRRATEVDFNTTVNLGDPVTGLAIPLSARVRNYVDTNGGSSFVAGVRASTRTSGLLLSNTLDYTRTTNPGFETTAQLFGNFDLATLSRSDTRARFSLGYRILPEPDITNAGIEIDHALDERTSLRGTASYDFIGKAPAFGASAIRDFDRFSLALDGNYSFANDSYYVGLRLGFSLGRDPMSKRVYMARPGVATSGGAALRAFQDMDGDGVYGPTDRPLPDVDFVAFNQTAKTDKAGMARIGGLGTGRGIGIQIDPASLPDIDLAPAKPGVELVPRAGRLQTVDYAIIAVSEIEGIASFASDGGTKGVSGVKLQLTDESGKIVGIVKTELDGYYFFERVPPGRYRITLDPDQASRLNLCPVDFGMITVGYESSLLAKDIEIGQCKIDRPVIARAEGDATAFGSE